MRKVRTQKSPGICSPDFCHILDVTIGIFLIIRRWEIPLERTPCSLGACEATISPFCRGLYAPDSSSRSEQEGQFDKNSSPFGLHSQPCTLGQLLDPRVVSEGSAGHGYGKEVETLDHHVTIFVHFKSGRKFCLLYYRDVEHIRFIDSAQQNKGICKDRKRNHRKS